MQAPGGPGTEPGWGPARKQAFGTAPGRQSRVWFTVADGNLSDVFHPAVDQPVLSGLRFLAAAPGAPPVDDATEATHAVRWIEPGVPSFRIESRHVEYELDTELVSDPDRDALLISGDFRPEMPDVRLYLQASPHGVADGYVLDRDPPVLAARVATCWLVIVGPLGRASAGYLNSSDLFVDLDDSAGAMNEEYASAPAGGVALGAVLAVAAGRFQLAMGFGRTREQAEETAREALERGAAATREAFARAWRQALPDLPPNVAKVTGDGGALARASLAVLRCLEDKERPGAFVASPAAPWQEPTQSYSLVWNRDLFNIASALVDAGDHDSGRRALAYVGATQLEDGSWAQNHTVAGQVVWPGVELDHVAFPILLAWRLGVLDALGDDPYPDLVKPAAAYLLTHGPATGLDRWEDAGGLSPSTLANSIAALAAAAEFAEDAGEEAAAAHLRAVADYWNDRVEAWTYLRPFRHYVRLAADPDAGAQREDTVGVEFVELSRRGLRQASDPRILNSLTTADVLLRVPLPGGPAWRRYAGDRYGEADDGSPWSAGAPGRGRAWPLLTGERGHHALAVGQPVAEYVAALEAWAGPELLIPEQVWDADPVPGRGLEPGHPTHSARPLGWAHAEYLKLVIGLAGSRQADLVDPAHRRYADRPLPDPPFIWSHEHDFGLFPEGRIVWVQIDRPGTVRWTGDGWATHSEVEARDTTLGCWVTELPTDRMRVGSRMVFTVRHGSDWEGVNHTLTCRAE